MKIKKRAITLVEIMIVISLIAIIGGVLSYNLKGALDKGKAFKTEQARHQIMEAFELMCSDGEITPQQIVDSPMEYLKKSDLIKDPENMIKDGWGTEMKIDYQDGEFVFFSEKFDNYQKKHKTPSDK